MILLLFDKFYNFIYLKKLKKNGIKIGEKFQMEKGCNLDTPFAWLIEIGNNVTLASRVYILAHDASTKKLFNYSKVGRVIIEDNVFVGAHSIILPNVRIGKNSIIGANSVVTKSVKENVVVAGNPAKEICSLDEFYQRNEIKFNEAPKFGSEWTLKGNISEEKKVEMKRLLNNKMGYID